MLGTDLKTTVGKIQCLDDFPQHGTEQKSNRRLQQMSIARPGNVVMSEIEGIRFHHNQRPSQLRRRLPGLRQRKGGVLGMFEPDIETNDENEMRDLIAMFQNRVQRIHAIGKKRTHPQRRRNRRDGGSLGTNGHDGFVREKTLVNFLKSLAILQQQRGNGCLHAQGQPSGHGDQQAQRQRRVS